MDEQLKLINYIKQEVSKIMESDVPDMMLVDLLHLLTTLEPIE